MKAILGEAPQQGVEAVAHRMRFWSRRRLEILHGLRISAAGLASYAVAEVLRLPQGYWAVFTAVLVVQGSVGGSWKASTDRLLGTLLGAAYGTVVATAIPHGDAFTTGAALTVSLLPLSMLAAFKPAYRVAPITAIILLLGSTGATEGPVRAAMLRTLEVALGGICGMAVSLFLFPARAHMLLGELADKVLQRMSALFAELVAAITRAAATESIRAKQDSVGAAQTELENIAAEAARERRNHLSEDVDPAPIARTLRRLRHDLVLIGRIVSEPVVKQPTPVFEEILGEFSQTGVGQMRAIGRAFAARVPPAPLEPFETAIQKVLAALQQIAPEERVIALRFSLQQFQENLQDLHQRAREFAAAQAPVKT